MSLGPGTGHSHSVEHDHPGAGHPLTAQHCTALFTLISPLKSLLSNALTGVSKFVDRFTCHMI